MLMQTMEVTLDRKSTNYNELMEIIDAVGGYPVMAKDFDGTKLAISYKENGSDEWCMVFEPGVGEEKTRITNYHKDGRVEVTHASI